VRFDLRVFDESALRAKRDDRVAGAATEKNIRGSLCVCER